MPARSIRSLPLDATPEARIGPFLQAIEPIVPSPVVFGPFPRAAILLRLTAA